MSNTLSNKVALVTGGSRSARSEAVSTDREQMSSRDRATLSVVSGYPVGRAWVAPRRGDAGRRERQHRQDPGEGIATAFSDG
jgi:hypothetical protein